MSYQNRFIHSGTSVVDGLMAYRWRYNSWRWVSGHVTTVPCPSPHRHTDTQTHTDHPHPHHLAGLVAEHSVLAAGAWWTLVGIGRVVRCPSKGPALSVCP